MSALNSKLHVISQTLNQELIEQILRPLNATICDKTSAFNIYKGKNNIDAYLENIKQTYLKSSEDLSKTVECDVLAYLGMASRDDYLNQFNNVCQELENRSIRVSRHYTKTTSIQLQENNLILSKSLLLFAKHICKTFRIYRHVSDQGEYVERLCELEISRIIKPSFVNMFMRTKLLLVYASMQPEDCLMVNIFKKLGVKTATLQHGLYVNYLNTDTINKINYQIQPAEHFLSWGDETSQLIYSYHPKTIIHNCGRPILYAEKNIASDKSKKKVILICLDQKLYEAENLKMIETVVEAKNVLQDQNYEIKLRLHPQLRPNFYKQNFPDLDQCGELSDTTLLIGHTTTMLHEAAYKGLRTYKFKTVAECVSFPAKYCFSSPQELIEILQSPIPYNNSFTRQFFHSVGTEAINKSANAIQAIIDEYEIEPNTITYKLERTSDTTLTISNEGRILPAQTFVIATTVFNETNYIEETINSILHQEGDYELYYIVKDASNNIKSSIEIGQILGRKIPMLAVNNKKINIIYAHKSDSGMYEGLLDAFSLIRYNPKPDDIVSYINADDILESDAFEKVQFAFKNKNCKLLLARTTTINSKDGGNRRVQKSPYHYSSKKMIEGTPYLGIDENAFIQQEGSFWSGSIHTKVLEVLNLKPKVAGDYLIWKYLSRFTEFYISSITTGLFRMRIGQKSEDIDSYFREIKELAKHPLFTSSINNNDADDIGYLFMAASQEICKFPLFAAFRSTNNRLSHSLVISDDTVNSSAKYFKPNELRIFAEIENACTDSQLSESNLIGNWHQIDTIYHKAHNCTYNITEIIQQDNSYELCVDFLVANKEINHKKIGIGITVSLECNNERQSFDFSYSLVPHVNLYKLRSIIKVNGNFINHSKCKLSIKLNGESSKNTEVFIPRNLLYLIPRANLSKNTVVKSSVSVITITYNDLKNLKKTVESFKKFSALNTQFKLEYIVIDGNSTDGTKSYLQSQSQYIDKFISEKDSGIYDAMNKGIKMAGKEYVWFMNAGDEFIPKKLFKLDLLLKEHAYDVIYGDRIYIDTDDNKEYTQKAKKISEIQYGMCFGHQSTIYNRQILEKYLFNLTYKYAGDYEQLIRLYLNNKSFKYISFPLCRFYSGGASESGIGPHLEATYIQSKYFKADTLKKSRYINGSIIHLKNIMEEVKHGN